MAPTGSLDESTGRRMERFPVEFRETDGRTVMLYTRARFDRTGG